MHIRKWFVPALAVAGLQWVTAQDGLVVNSPGSLAGLRFAHVTTDRAFVGEQAVSVEAQIVVVSDEDMATACEARLRTEGEYPLVDELLAKYSGTIVLFDATDHDDGDPCGDADVFADEIISDDFRRQYYGTVGFSHLFNASFVRVMPDDDWVGYGVYLHSGDEFAAHIDAGLVHPGSAVLITSQLQEPRTQELLAHLRQENATAVFGSLDSTGNTFQRLFDRPATQVVFRGLLPALFLGVAAKAAQYWFFRVRRRVKTVAEIHVVLAASFAVSVAVAVWLAIDGNGTTPNINDRWQAALRGAFYGTGVGVDLVILQSFQRVLYMGHNKAVREAAGVLSRGPKLVQTFRAHNGFTVLGVLFIFLDVGAIYLVWTLKSSFVVWLFIPLIFVAAQLFVIVLYTYSGHAILARLKQAQSSAAADASDQLSVERSEKQRDFMRRLALSLLFAAAASFFSILCLGLIGAGVGYFASPYAFVFTSVVFLLSRAVHTFAQILICKPPLDSEGRANGTSSSVGNSPPSYNATSNPSSSAVVSPSL